MKRLLFLVCSGLLAFASGCTGTNTVKIVYVDGGVTTIYVDAGIPICLVGSTKCGSTCANLKEDQQHCGACGTVCDPGTVCSNGTCATTCQAGLSACGPSCKSLQDDNFNCGTCGTVCATTQRCARGACQTWQDVSDAGPGYGLTDSTPAGSEPIVTTGSNIYQFNSSDGGWVDLASGLTLPGGYSYGARRGGNLYWIAAGASAGSSYFYSYPSADGGVDKTLIADISSTSDNQNTVDDHGNVWTVTTDSHIVSYNIDAGTVSSLDSGTGVGSSEPRIAWDSLSQKVFFADYDNNPSVFSLDPATSTVSTLLKFPDTGNLINDGFCSDHLGHIYTVNSSGTNNSLFTYDTLRDTWTVSYFAFALGSSGSCSVTGDGYLYLENGDTSHLFRIRVF